MGGAIARGVVASGFLRSTQVCVAEPDPKKRKAFKREGIRTFSDNRTAVRFADVLIIAVKPASVESVAKDISDALSPSQCVVSIAAGVRIARIARRVRGIPLIRVMPNNPCLIGQGMSAIAAGKTARRSDVLRVLQIFRALGDVVVVPEGQLDVVTGLSGSGPAFVYEFASGLMEGTRGKLPPLLAHRLSLQTILGSARTAQISGKTLDQLVTMVASPKGTTVAGLHALSKKKFRNIVAQAVRAATRRAEELSK